MMKIVSFFCCRVLHLYSI